MMKLFKLLLIIFLLTACAAPSHLPRDEFLEDQAPRGEFLTRVNLVNHSVSLQSTTVKSPNLIILERNAFTSRVQLSLEQADGTPLPSGIRANFLPNNTVSNKSALVISIGARVPATTYTLRIKAVSGTLTKYATLNLSVLAANSNWMACLQNGWPECSFTGLREVRFGANGNYVSKLFYDYAGLCQSGDFDGLDPAPGVVKSCEYGPMKTKTLKNPNLANGLGNTLIVPLGDPGSLELRVRPTGQQPGPSDGTGAFRVVCDYSHMAFDDPIVYPGQAGKSHLHTFFGNTRTSAYSTDISIARSGNSSCTGGSANRSAYWVPTLLDAQHKPILPASTIIYYKTGYRGVDPATVKRIPTGLRMIAGNTSSSVAQENMIWGCLENYIPNTGFIPTAGDCSGAAKHVQLSVIFPQCWDGVNLDSLNHKSHMAYPTPGQGCPASHPVALPEITINVRYKIPALGTTSWRLSSDTYSTSLPGGFSLHGDFMNGWNPSISKLWIENCDNPALDCHADLLGQGDTLY
jgi:Domain of unknown function (DUF1996)